MVRPTPHHAPHPTSRTSAVRCAPSSFFLVCPTPPHLTHSQTPQQKQTILSSFGGRFTLVCQKPNRPPTNLPSHPNEEPISHQTTNPTQPKNSQPSEYPPSMEVLPAKQQLHKEKGYRPGEALKSRSKSRQTRGGIYKYKERKTGLNWKSGHIQIQR